MPEIRIIALPVATTADRPVQDLEKVASEAGPEIVDALTKGAPEKKGPASRSFNPKTAEVLTFRGRNHADALENMEKFFLSHRWSDGLPLVPPTPEAVEAMLKGTHLPRDHSVGVVDPVKGIATIEKIAINAVMAGARPAYMPLVIAVVRAITDPAFDLYGVQCTGGLAAPLFIVSGPIIKDLNINFSYSTAGPGWRANSTIGRAARLILINLGQAWPGVNDMKDIGNPAKFGILIAENEAQTPKGWPTLREQEGFRRDVSTVSVYASQSYRQFHDSQKYFVSMRPPKPVVDPMVLSLMKTSLNSTAEQWGADMVVVFSPVVAEHLSRLGYTPSTIAEELYEKGRKPRGEFGARPLGAVRVAKDIPQWIDDLPEEGLVPVVRKAEDMKVFVAGGRGPGSCLLIDGWGFGNSRFVTKQIELPPNWDELLEDLSGWETPIEVK